MFLNFFSNFTMSLWMRDALAFLTAFFIMVFAMPGMIRFLQRQQMGQVIRALGPESHFSKKGTPTMGGVLIILSMVIAILLWCHLTNPFVWMALTALVGYGLIGWFDDYFKVIRKNTDGLKSRWKFFWQSLLALGLGCWLYHIAPESQDILKIPGVPSWIFHIGFGIIVLSYFMISGFSNAVNLTDGLDGLAILPSITVALAVCLLAYLSADGVWASKLGLIYNVHNPDVSVIAASLVGAGLGFLWFNAFPAQVFMGDVGALPLGALFGLMAMMLHIEILMLIMGGIFVMETLSVMLQVGSFKLRGKRIFKMAPIHHHFELKGWPETRVVARFWIITVLLVCVSLLSIFWQI